MVDGGNYDILIIAELMKNVACKVVDAFQRKIFHRPNLKDIFC